MKILSQTVPITCCWLLMARVSYAFQQIPPGYYTRQLKAGPESRCETSLQMGLRSFLKKKVLGKDTDKTKNGATAASPPKKKKDATAKVTTTTTEPVKKLTMPPQPKLEKPAKTPPPARKKKSLPPLKEPAMRKKQELSSKLPPLETESVKDRLNRVRSGKMTEDEKQAFLRTALSAKDTAVSRKPLRQELPDGNANTTDARGNASPFPKDSLSGIFGNGDSGKDTDSHDLIPTFRNWKSGTDLEDQKKKRAYLDMVTNPNRFHTYKSSVVTEPGDTDPTIQHDGVVVPELEEETIRQDAGGNGTEDLGSRLEKAAHAMEEAAKAERSNEEKRLEMEKMEHLRHLEVSQKKQRLDNEKRELERKARKRENEENMVKAEAQRRKDEAARQRKLMEAQDEYWAKKLQAEREARAKGMTQTQKVAHVKAGTLEAEKAMKFAQEEAAKSQTPIVPPPPSSVSEPAVVEAKIEPQPPRPPPSERSTPDSFEIKQAQKQEEIDRAKDEQIAKLKALNSPLPSQSSPAPPAVTPQAGPSASRGASTISNTMSSPKPQVEPPSTEPSIADMMRETQAEAPKATSETDKAKKGVLPSFFGVKKDKAAEVKKAPDSDPPRKRIVRQALPLGDQDDDDDFDSFARNGPNKNLSIADAMKASGSGDGPKADQEQRSKMWGVDMSRIAQSLEDEKKGKN